MGIDLLLEGPKVGIIYILGSLEYGGWPKVFSTSDASLKALFGATLDVGPYTVPIVRGPRKDYINIA